MELGAARIGLFLTNLSRESVWIDRLLTGPQAIHVPSEIGRSTCFARSSLRKIGR